jgi:putative two-component system response regulator
MKPGRLTEEEFETMKTHTTLGARLLTGSGSPVLQMGTLIAESHHERWDGSGYPDGLAGEEIPVAARVFAVADTLDALTSDRPYRPASPLSVAREMITAESGSHFDPRVVEVFNGIPDERFEQLRAEIE